MITRKLRHTTAPAAQSAREIASRNGSVCPIPPTRGHRPANQSAHPGMARPVRLPSSESASANPMLMPAPAEPPGHQKRLATILCRKGGGEYRRQRRNRSIHQSRQARLNDLQHEQSALRHFFVSLHIGGQFCLSSSCARSSCSRSSFARSSSNWRMLASWVRPRPSHRSGASPLPSSTLLCAPLRSAAAAPATTRTIDKPAHVLPPDQRNVLAEFLLKSSSKRRRCPDSSSRMPSNIEAVAG